MIHSNEYIHTMDQNFDSALSPELLHSPVLLLPGSLPYAWFPIGPCWTLLDRTHRAFRTSRPATDGHERRPQEAERAVDHERRRMSVPSWDVGFTSEPYIPTYNMSQVLNLWTEHESLRIVRMMIVSYRVLSFCTSLVSSYSLCKYTIYIHMCFIAIALAASA